MWWLAAAIDLSRCEVWLVESEERARREEAEP